MKRALIYSFTFVVAILIRIVLNYQFELIPGINGGYYPLQVRCLLTDGGLGFSDMPLYFYFNAICVKCASLFIDLPQNDLIMQVVKITDSLFFPLLLIPFYKISKSITNFKLPVFYEIVILMFATLSFSPLNMVGGFQKNSFAIVFLTAFFLFGILYFKKPSKGLFLLLLLFFVLAGLSHFGVFSVILLTFIIGLIVFKEKKSLIPTLLICIVAIGIVAIIDFRRAHRLLFAFAEIFQHPAIINGKFGLIEVVNCSFAYLLIGLGIYMLKKHKEKIMKYERKILLTLLILLLVLSFPFYNEDYSRRLSMMLFIPQSILLLFIFKYLGKAWQLSLSILTIVPVLFFTIGATRINTPEITQEAYNDLKSLKQCIPEKKKTIIIARHGLDFWVAWELQTNIGNARKLKEIVSSDYEDILFIQQKKGINKLSMLLQFKEPEACFGHLLKLHDTEYFTVKKWIDENNRNKR